MDKYDKDMEKIDLDIQRKKNDYQNARDRRVHLEETVTMIVFLWLLDIEKHLFINLGKDFSIRIRNRLYTLIPTALVQGPRWLGDFKLIIEYVQAITYH